MDTHLPREPQLALPGVPAPAPSPPAVGLVTPMPPPLTQWSLPPAGLAQAPVPAAAPDPLAAAQAQAQANALAEQKKLRWRIVKLAGGGLLFGFLAGFGLAWYQARKHGRAWP